MQRSQPENPVEGISGRLELRKVIARGILQLSAEGREDGSVTRLCMHRWR